jgi:hypothetical protein
MISCQFKDTHLPHRINSGFNSNETVIYIHTREILILEKENLRKAQKRIFLDFAVVFVNVFDRVCRAFFRFGKFAPIVFCRADKTHVS